MKRIFGYVLAGVLSSILALVLLYQPAGSAAVQASAKTPTGPSASAPTSSTGQAGRPDLDATSQVLDVARLVLETTREQAVSVNGHIDRATTIIVVFFTTLAAVGAMFGWYKLQDIKTSAEGEIQAFRSRLATAETETAAKRAEFQKSLDDMTIAMRAEINAQSELMAARVQIDQALGSAVGALEERNRRLRGAIKRIVDVLEAERNLSLQARVRGLADKAYGEKRLGDTAAAFGTVVAAAALVKGNSELTLKMLPLLAFNAACYAAILEKDAEAIEWISTAIELKPEYKSTASKDPDFERLRNNPKFVAATQ